MLDATLRILPLLLIFLAGYGLKRAKFLSSEDGSSLLKLIFFAGAPALIFISVLKVELDISLFLLGLLAPIIATFTLLTGFVLRRSTLKSIPVKTFGAMLVGAAVMNTGFLLPFIQNLYGAEGLARFAVIDAFNALAVFGLVYAVAVRFGNNNEPRMSFIAKKLLVSPPLWALVLALILKSLNVTPPQFTMDTLSLVAGLVAPVVLLALGLKLTFKIEKPKLLLIPLFLRFIIGGLIGITFVKLFGLQGLDAQVAIFASLAPIGFNSITFAELERLDVGFAASQVSVGLIVGLIATPFIVHLLSFL